MRKKRSIEEIERILADQASSGLNQKEFCRQIELPYHTFLWYKKRIQQASGKKPIRFAEIQPSSKSFGNTYPLCIEVDGIKIKSTDETMILNILNKLMCHHA
jgi:hypothetical protein